MQQHKGFLFGISALSSAYSMPVLANDYNKELEEITVIGRTSNLLGSAMSASEGFVSQQELAIRPTLRIGELLELVPGMVATQHSGSGKANQYFLRGFNLDHGTDFATSIDAMPVNMRSHGHGQGYTDINFIIPELIQNLAYRKGSYYAETGDFSGAGSATFSTANTLDQGLASITLGKDSFQRYLLADGLEQILGGDLLVGLEYQSYAGPWTDINEDVNKINVLIKHSSKLGDGKLSVTFMAYDNSWNSADQIPLRAVEQGQIDALGSIDTNLGGESSRYSLSVAWDSDDAFLSAYVIDYDLDLFSNFTYFLDDPINGDQFEQVDQRKIYGASGHIHNDFNGLVNTLGFETRFDDINEVGLHKSVNQVRLGSIRSDAVEETSAAIYAKSSYDWSPQFRTLVGIRYDYYDFKVSSLIGENVNGINVADNLGKNNDDLVSLKASATYKFNDTIEAYLAAGQAFHSNDARGTIQQIDPNDGSVIAPVDPLVRSFGKELGLRVELLETLNASFSLWSLQLDSELLFVGDAGNTEASRPSYREGFEASVYYRFNQYWMFDAEYALSKAKFSDESEDGRHIPGSVERVLQLGVSAELQSGLTASVRLRHLGERPLLENASVTSEPSTIVNLLLSQQWQDWTLKLELLNLFDSKGHDIDYYYASRLSGEAEQGVEDLHFHQIEPRTLRLTAQMRF